NPARENTAGRLSPYLKTASFQAAVQPSFNKISALLRHTPRRRLLISIETVEGILKSCAASQAAEKCPLLRPSAKKILQGDEVCVDSIVLTAR
ncbi:MAG: hypothetical protein ABSE99_18325, partial [Terracidiphilus sp.]